MLAASLQGRIHGVPRQTPPDPARCDAASKPPKANLPSPRNPRCLSRQQGHGHEDGILPPLRGGVIAPTQPGLAKALALIEMDSGPIGAAHLQKGRIGPTLASDGEQAAQQTAAKMTPAPVGMDAEVEDLTLPRGQGHDPMTDQVGVDLEHPAVVAGPQAIQEDLLTPRVAVASLLDGHDPRQILIRHQPEDQPHRCQPHPCRSDDVKIPPAPSVTIHHRSSLPVIHPRPAAKPYAHHDNPDAPHDPDPPYSQPRPAQSDLRHEAGGFNRTAMLCDRFGLIVSAMDQARVRQGSSGPGCSHS